MKETAIVLELVEDLLSLDAIRTTSDACSHPVSLVLILTLCYFSIGRFLGLCSAVCFTLFLNRSLYSNICMYVCICVSLYALYFMDSLNSASIFID